MTSLPGACLVDTNVLVYAVDGRNADKQARAIATLEQVHALGSGVLTAQILGEFFVTVTRKLPSPLSEADAERLVEDYAASWEVCDVRSGAVVDAIRGLRRYQFSYWDALVWATARQSGVRYILSEDFNDGATIEGVGFLNPFRRGLDIEQLLTGPPAADERSLRRGICEYRASDAKP